MFKLNYFRRTSNPLNFLSENEVKYYKNNLYSWATIIQTSKHTPKRNRYIID